MKIILTHKASFCTSGHIFRKFKKCAPSFVFPLLVRPSGPAADAGGEMWDRLLPALCHCPRYSHYQ